MRKLLLFLGGLICVVQSYSQETGEDKLGAWYMYFGTNKVAEKWSIHTEAQFRFYEVASSFNQLLLRTGINRHLEKGAMVTLGYAYIETESFDQSPESETSSFEHRIFEQLIMKNELGKFDFMHRYRLEQRWVNSNGPADYLNRFRYMLMITYPLGDKFFLNAYGEIFINFEDDLFDQSRLFFALGYRFSKDLNVRLGYLKNHFSDAHFDRLQLAIFFDTDLRKKEQRM